MKAIDYRNRTWESVQILLSGFRAQVYEAYVRFGPGTTREISRKSEISILTLRPRTTELMQLGFIEILCGTDDGREAVYIAVPVSTAQERFEWYKAQPVQAELPLK
jgi:sugar-specific transcriptional regulator TrmB